MLPLTMADSGEVYQVRRVSGNEEVRHFLGNLGILPGSEISVVSSAIGGNVIVSVKDSRVAINAEMARHIMV